MPIVTVYTAKPCGYCTAAIRYLKGAKKLEVEEIDLTHNTELRIKLIRETGHRTVPMIYINGQFIGGYDELRKLDAQKQLDLLINKGS
ncbi:MAG: glutaredoxin [Myxococcota bacterium]